MSELTDLEKQPSPTMKEEEDIRRERKMKMKEIQNSLFGKRLELFSPPDLTHVNEWRQKFGKAEAQKMEERSRKKKGLFFSAFKNSTDKLKSRADRLDTPSRQDSDPNTDVKRRKMSLEYEKNDNWTESESNCDKVTSERRGSLTTKLFQDGVFNDTEDPGYSSSSSPPNGDPLSQSVPGSLSSSISSTKVLYDERIYEDRASYPDTTESGYFQTMKTFHSSTSGDPGINIPNSGSSKERNGKNTFLRQSSEEKSKIKRFFNDSLGWKSQKSNDIPSRTSKIPSTDIENEGTHTFHRKNDVEDSYSSPVNRDSFLISSATPSEFGEPNDKGIAQQKHSVSTLLKTLPNVFGFVVEKKNRDASSNIDQKSLNENGNNWRECDCPCKNRESFSRCKLSSWGTFLFLLVIDLVTIILILCLFEKIKELKMYEGLGNSPPIAGSRSLTVTSASTTTSLITTFPFNKVKEPQAQREPKVIRGRNLDIFDSSSTVERSPARDERNVVISRSFDVFEVDKEITPPDLEISTIPAPEKSVTSTTLKNLAKDEPVSTRQPFTKPKDITIDELFSTPRSTERSITSRTSKDIAIDMTVDLLTVEKVKKEIDIMKEEMLLEVKTTIADIGKEVKALRRELESIRKPPMFSCYRTSEQNREGVVKYTDCNVRTDGISPQSGVFTVKTPGVYKLSFTGLFNVINGHAVFADIIKNSNDLEYSILGRSSADTKEVGQILGKYDDDLMVSTTVIVAEKLNLGDEISVRVKFDGKSGLSKILSSKSVSIHFLGIDDTIHATTTVLVMAKLSVGERIYVTMTIEGNHGKSRMYSSSNPAIHFTGVKISD